MLGTQHQQILHVPAFVIKCDIPLLIIGHPSENYVFNSCYKTCVSIALPHSRLSRLEVSAYFSLWITIHVVILIISYS